METDLLIIGSGVAGLTCALKVAADNPSLRVTVLDKSEEHESNTKYAQGGIAAVTNDTQDSILLHFKDTIEAGNGRCKTEIVAQIIQSAPKGIEQLENWGVRFDRNPDGSWSLGLEGGHSHPRILHAKDSTGKEIISKLLDQIQKAPNIQLLKNHHALDLITNTLKGIKTCCGAWVYDIAIGKEISILAKATVLATGGSGQLFARTTNPSVATGDGVAMARRAGAVIEDMHFYQFHPTSFYQKNTSRAFLITEALRGAGARIVNHRYQRFLFKGDSRGELATRDIVSRLINEELRSSMRDHVFLDARHIDKATLREEFPGVLANCLEQGYDLTKDFVPITPAAHYQCGGIAVNAKGESSVPGLYALGECAHTGLHGSNRLASNSLLEAVVCAMSAANPLGKHINDAALPRMSMHGVINITPITAKPELESTRECLQSAMTNLFCGEEPDLVKVEDLINKVDQWRAEVNYSYLHGHLDRALLELRNLLEVADVMCSHLKDSLQDVEHYQNI
jgi:L-aspartate oxidase